MKTKLFALFAAIFSLSALSSCNAPYGYGSSSYNGGYRRQYGNNSTLGGYRGGGSGGGFGGSYGGFGGR
jgi:hypothetical protein